MRWTTIAGAVAIGFCLRMPMQDPSAILLTVPQQDAWRSGWSATPAGLSADGRWIAFDSYARLAPADTNSHRDVYVLDRITGRVTLESLTTEGQVLTADSGYPRLSGDGRYLVFETAIAGPDGAPIGVEIVLRDREQNTTRHISRGASGPISAHGNRAPAISADGRIVVFASGATDLVAGRDENGTEEDVYQFEVATGLVRRISVDSHGAQRPGGASFAPSVSADGRYVAFTSKAALDGENARPIASIFVRDTQLGTTERVSVCARGIPPDGPSSDPAISRDGRYVAFVSEATNLVPGDRNRSPDIFLRDLRMRSTALISRSASGGPGNGPSGNPVVSADGRFVAFQSQASDLVCARRCARAVEDVNLLSDVFLFDRVMGLMTWVSAGPAGGWAEESTAPQVDAGGAVVAFTSRHPIDERDVSNDFDLFVRVRADDPPARAGSHDVTHSAR
jgi:Tol biopolymer transport system component